MTPNRRARHVSRRFHLPLISSHCRAASVEQMKIDRRRFLGMGLASAALGSSGCANGVRAKEPRPVARLGGEIQHLVVLMMENRSYDQMLGALPGDKYAGPPPGT